MRELAAALEAGPPVGSQALPAEPVSRLFTTLIRNYSIRQRGAAEIHIGKCV